LFIQEQAEPKQVKRLILCSGKVAYDLARRRKEAQRDDLAIVRVEQLYPLHTDMLERVVSAYPNAEIVWVQEEPKNAGAYQYFDHALQESLGWSPLPYIGRSASATPAVGSKKIHDQEHERMLRQAVGEPVKQEKKTVAAS